MNLKDLINKHDKCDHDCWVDKSNSCLSNFEKDLLKLREKQIQSFEKTLERLIEKLRTTEFNTLESWEELIKEIYELKGKLDLLREEYDQLKNENTTEVKA